MLFATPQTIKKRQFFFFSPLTAPPPPAPPPAGGRRRRLPQPRPRRPARRRPRPPGRPLWRAGPRQGERATAAAVAAAPAVVQVAVAVLPPLRPRTARCRRRQRAAWAVAVAGWWPRAPAVLASVRLPEGALLAAPRSGWRRRPGAGTGRPGEGESERLGGGRGGRGGRTDPDPRSSLSPPSLLLLPPSLTSVGSGSASASRMSASRSATAAASIWKRAGDVMRLGGQSAKKQRKKQKQKQVLPFSPVSAMPAPTALVGTSRRLATLWARGGRRRW